MLQQLRAVLSESLNTASGLVQVAGSEEDLATVLLRVEDFVGTIGAELRRRSSRPPSNGSGR